MRAHEKSMPIKQENCNASKQEQTNKHAPDLFTRGWWTILFKAIAIRGKMRTQSELNSVESKGQRVKSCGKGI